jgi:flagellar biosynthesis/type III secretory pathway protein FliH
MRISRASVALLALLTSLWMAAPAAADQRDYDRGYRDGYDDALNEARSGRSPSVGIDLRLGPDFRRGYADGYRRALDQAGRRNRSRGWGPRLGPARPDRNDRGGQDPAFARGYADGFERGLDDGRDRDRYDPVRHRDYRDGDQGYFREYGVRDAYRNNYRAGFRRGYEEGYRDGGRGRRR